MKSAVESEPIEPAAIRAWTEKRTIFIELTDGRIKRSATKGSLFNSMFKFLLIFPTPALEKNFDPRNTSCIPAVKIFFRLGFEQIS